MVKSVFQAQYQKWKMDVWMRGVKSICLSVWLYERSRAVRRAEITLIPQAAHLRYTAGAGNSNSIIVTISARQGSWRCPCSAGLCLFRMHIYLSSLVKCLSCQALCDPKFSRVRQAAGGRPGFLQFCSSESKKELEWMNQLSDSFLLYPPRQRRMLFFSLACWKRNKSALKSKI